MSTTKPSSSPVQPPANPRDALFDLLEGAVGDGVFPGCVALLWRSGTIVYEESHGTLGTHPEIPAAEAAVARGTVYDLASLTKVLCTTSLVALAVSEHKLNLDDPVPDPWATACPGATLRDILAHASGLRAHREYFAEVDGIDAGRLMQLVAETPVEYPLRSKSVYSDLGFMILGAWLEDLYGRPLDQLFEDRIAFPLDLEGQPVAPMGFRRVTAPELLGFELERLIAPTEVYDASLHDGAVPSHVAVRNQVPYAHGIVHDDNAYTMGGVAGHAGLFGTAQAVLEIALGWLELRLPGLDAAVRDRFWQRSGVPGSTRCLGFDGPSPDGSGATGSALSSSAVGHTGYTGTSLWIDPAAPGGPRIFILLSNRVHPVRTNAGIRELRPRFHELAMRL